MLWYAEMRDQFGGVGSTNCGFQMVEAETEEEAKVAMKKKRDELAQDKLAPGFVISSGVKGQCENINEVKEWHKRDHPYAKFD